MTRHVRIGTRKSKLALWQSNYVASLINNALPGIVVELREIVTKGDKNLDASLPSIGGKGLFTAELEEELVQGSIDLAVHSLKDLPTDLDPRFVLGAILPRGSSRDALVSRENLSFSELPQGAVVGTSSPRRASQIKRLRPDLVLQDIRGNVDSRVRKVREGKYDATVLAEAGLARLSLLGEIAHYFSFDEILPAPAQGAMAIQAYSGRKDLTDLFLALDCKKTRCEVSAERAFLRTLQAGCSTPIATLAVLEGDSLSLQGRCVSPDGKTLLEVKGNIRSSTLGESEANELGVRLAHEAIRKGFILLK